MKQYQKLGPSQKKPKLDSLQNIDSSLLYKNCQNQSPSQIEYKKFKRQSNNTELQLPGKKIHTNDDDQTTTTGTLGFDQSQASNPAHRPINGRRKPCIEELFDNFSTSQNFQNGEQFSENFDGDRGDLNNLSMTNPFRGVVNNFSIKSPAGNGQVVICPKIEAKKPASFADKFSNPNPARGSDSQPIFFLMAISCQLGWDVAQILGFPLFPSNKKNNGNRNFHLTKKRTNSTATQSAPYPRESTTDPSPTETPTPTPNHLFPTQTPTQFNSRSPRLPPKSYPPRILPSYQQILKIL